MALAKDYSISKVEIEVNLQKDGSALVKEIRTYNFDGSFSWADEWINLKAKCSGCKNYLISDFSLEDEKDSYVRNSSNLPHSYSLEELKDRFYVKWFYSATNESKTFTLKYKIQNAVTNHKDIAEFYWQLVGDEWPKASSEVRARVFLPSEAPNDKIWAFGHGPSDGKINIVSSREVDFYATNLAPKTFFEVRILFPKLENAPFVQNSNLTLESILKEEKNFASQKKLRVWAGFLISLLIFAVLVWRGVYWFLIWHKYGKDPKLPEVNLSGQLHEPPSDLHPIYVQALLDKGKIDGKVITATIIELARRKILAFKKEQTAGFLGSYKNEYSLVLLDRNGEMNKYEKELVNLLFDSAETITFSDIKKLGSEKPVLMFSFWRDLAASRKDLVSLGFLDKTALQMRGRLAIELFIIFIAGIFSLSFVFPLFMPIFQFGGVFFLLLLPVIFFVFIWLLVLFFVMEKRTDKGNQEMAGWLAFKRFLKEYSITKNYPIDSVVLWEKYLVYGTVLGISIKALSQLPIKYSEDFEKSPVLVGSVGSGGNVTIPDLSSSFAALDEELSSLSSSFSSGAYGVGSSGGFSGGGGGGGAG